MAPTLNGMPVTVFVGDYADALQDWTPYVEGPVQVPTPAADLDVTTFNPTGMPVGAAHIPGAMSLNGNMSIIYTPTWWALARPIFGKRTGVALLIKAGSNAPAVGGDEVFSATILIVEPRIRYAPGEAFKIPLPFTLVDGAAVPQHGYKG